MDIRIASAGEAAAATEILSDGFADDPVMRWVFGETVRAALPVMFGFMLREVLIPVGATYIDGDCCAVWTPPGRDPWATEDRGGRFLEAMTDVLDDGSLHRMIVLNELVERIHSREPHWYLGMLATRTAAQGTGAGSRLLAHTLQRVDHDRFAAHLESTNPRNVPFYERHGFVVLGEERLPDGPLITPMRRDHV